jgi:hypothetical protein
VGGKEGERSLCLMGLMILQWNFVKPESLKNRVVFWIERKGGEDRNFSNLKYHV